ncbi:hypothetical protein [Peribacillus simplex]|uniref:Uncharacterized protein n=1 Tax=Peribacillus simplex NBRC 15720 = DSM 1321 TaxID=1349754 RepID=A0A223EJK3_9BACI|nr:hypothetical protein [Peribacillus simplex]ASS95432.1 hypothetical protein BS1321_16850 [Peribacillus simplex NBRC 15720 = DSM 1321]MEC1397994.1 hypothetical protein [Peribacillus simplex]
MKKIKMASIEMEAIFILDYSFYPKSAIISAEDYTEIRGLTTFGNEKVYKVNNLVRFLLNFLKDVAYGMEN